MHCFLKVLTTFSLRKKCPYLELFLSEFSRIRTRITRNKDIFYAVFYKETRKIVSAIVTKER